MRILDNCKRHGVRAALATLLLASATVAPANAQIIFDGNLLWRNGGTLTLAGQFTGAFTDVTAPADTCPSGYNALQLGTVTFTNNTYADPLLSGALYPGTNFRPAPGSPAFGGNAPHGKTVKLPVDGFFTSPCFVGAIGPDGDDWTTGWTYYDSLGTGRDDLHLPGMTDPRPLAIYDNVSLYAPQTWGPDSNYLVRGQLRVKDQSSLTIAAGTVIFEERASIGTMIVERGGRIFAIGTRTEPIIITTDAAPGSQTIGSTGGLIIHGRSRANIVNTCAGDSAASEGGLVGYYGGSDVDDDSGELKYVRVEYAGREITPNNELNSFVFNAVGRKTRISYLQAHRGLDDLFEFFGGTAEARYLVGTDGLDDGFDWQLGFRGKAQFVVLRMNAQNNPAQRAEKAIEADNNEFDNNAAQCAGRSHPTLSNFTMVGDRRAGPDYPGVTAGVNLRRGTGAYLVNSIVTEFKSAALRIDDYLTWVAHCLPGIPSSPGLQCDGATVGVPVSHGRLFVSSGYPNPFTNRVAIRFALPKTGPTRVDVFAANGRLVTTLANGLMAAGEHTLNWQVDRATPSGVYFYKVVSGGSESTGKLVRVD